MSVLQSATLVLGVNTIHKRPGYIKKPIKKPLLKTTGDNLIVLISNLLQFLSKTTCECFLLIKVI